MVNSARAGRYWNKSDLICNKTLTFFNSVNDTGPLTLDPKTGKPVKDASGNVIPINPHGFKDQHYPNVHAGFSALNNSAGDPMEAMGSLWYHDHHLDYTAQNVYKGMFGCYTLFDDQDTGEETSGLHLPSGKYDVPIFFNDALVRPRLPVGIRPV